MLKLYSFLFLFSALSVATGRDEERPSRATLGSGTAGEEGRPSQASQVSRRSLEGKDIEVAAEQPVASSQQAVERGQTDKVESKGCLTCFKGGAK